MAKAAPGEDGFEAQWRDAVAAGKATEIREPRAVAVRFSPAARRLKVDLVNGATLLIPVSLLQGLAHASDRQLCAAEIVGGGYAIHWEELDCDFTVPGLVAGIFGARGWMSEMARSAGRVSSPAKARAARENGRKGGRPVKRHKKLVVD